MIELVAALNTVISTYSKVKELYEKIDDLETRHYILEMNEQLLNAKEAALELRDENYKLKEELNKLKQFEGKGLVLKKKAYYDKNNNGPYCPVCYDNEKKLVLLSSDVTIQLWCSKCGYTLLL